MRRALSDADIAFVDAHRGPAIGHLDPDVNPTRGSGSSGRAAGRQLYADIRRRSSVDTRGLQRVQWRVHAVGSDADSGARARVHPGGVPHDGVRKRLHQLAGWREHRHALEQRARVVVSAWRVALYAIAIGST